MPIPTPVGGKAEEVEEMILCQWSMNCYFMGMQICDADLHVSVAGNLIRLFLTSLAVVDKSMSPVLQRKLPTWVTQYNCQCLLNLPAQMRMLGSIRNRWEGGKRGEVFLRVVKPIVQSGRKN